MQMGSSNSGGIVLVLIALFFIISLVGGIFSRAARKIFGGIYLLLGGIGLIYGIIRYTSTEVKIARVFGVTDEVSVVCIAGGIILAVVGIIFLSVGRSKPVYINPQGGMNPQTDFNPGMWQPAPGPAPAPVIEVTRIRCTSCKALNDENASFCGGCGAPLK